MLNEVNLHRDLPNLLIWEPILKISLLDLIKKV